MAGIIGFTYTFVNELPAAEVESPVTTTVAASTTTSTSTTAATTTTTLPPEIVAFVDLVATFSTDAAGLVETATQLNEDWDTRTITFGDVRSGLGDLRGTTSDFNDAVAGAEIPEAAAETWLTVVESAAEMNDAADDMLDGLVNSAGSERRLAALDDYKIAEATLQRALSDAESAATG